jgi:hypothetical protein
MNFVMGGAEKKRFGVFTQTMRRFDEYAETFFKKPEAFRKPAVTAGYLFAGKLAFCIN